MIRRELIHSPLGGPADGAGLAVFEDDGHLHFEQVGRERRRGVRVIGGLKEAVEETHGSDRFLGSKAYV
jgi:hypothetical protein